MLFRSLLDLHFLERSLTRPILSRTPALVPENLIDTVSKTTELLCYRETYLKNMVGTSFQLFLVIPDLLTTPICTSSIISIAPTGTPALMILAAALAASLMVGNVTTATLVSWGMTWSLSVISVTMPSVPCMSDQ